MYYITSDKSFLNTIVSIIEKDSYGRISLSNSTRMTSGIQKAQISSHRISCTFILLHLCLCQNNNGGRTFFSPVTPRPPACRCIYTRFSGTRKWHLVGGSRYMISNLFPGVQGLLSPRGVKVSLKFRPKISSKIEHFNVSNVIDQVYIYICIIKLKFMCYIHV